jgi:hypothetical protein
MSAKGSPAKHADAANEPWLTDWMDEVTDFADTAGLIESLDLVISTDLGGPSCRSEATGMLC